MKAPIGLLLWLISVPPGWSQTGGTGVPVKAFEFQNVAPAATVVPDRLEEELIQPQGVSICGTRSWRCPLLKPEGRTYGQTSVRRLQKAWRDSTSPKPEPKKSRIPPR